MPTAAAGASLEKFFSSPQLPLTTAAARSTPYRWPWRARARWGCLPRCNTQACEHLGFLCAVWGLVCIISVPVFIALLRTGVDPAGHISVGTSEALRASAAAAQQANVWHARVFGTLLLVMATCFVRTKVSGPGSAAEWEVQRPDLIMPGGWNSDRGEELVSVREGGESASDFSRQSVQTRKFMEIDSAEECQQSSEMLSEEKRIDASQGMQESCNVRKSLEGAGDVFASRRRARTSVELGSTRKEGDWQQCNVCNAPKPPRVSHCSTCNRCVLRMDHHCVWIGTCVGMMNLKFFVLFLIYTLVACLDAVFLLCRFFHRYDVAPSYRKSSAGLVLSTFAPFVITIALAVAVWMGALLSDQLRAIAVNQTAVEDFKYRKRKEESRKKRVAESGEHVSEEGVGQRTDKAAHLAKAGEVERGEYDGGLYPNLVHALGPSPWLWLIPVAESRAKAGLRLTRLER